MGDHGNDHELAGDAARQAGELLVRLRHDLAGSGADRLRAEGDRRSHDHIAALLAAARPHDALLSEEGADDPVRLTAERVWIVDPLDGTREYSEPDRTDWAVHVALWERGAVVAGAVALPALGRLYVTPQAPARRSVAGADGPVRIAVSRSRPPAFVTALPASMGAVLVPIGSAGAKAMAVVDGTVDAYIHAGGQYEWDSAAPVAVARAAGLHTSRIDGATLRYNQPDPYLPDLLICRPDLADSLIRSASG